MAGRTADSEESKQGNQDPNVRKHQAEGDHSNTLCNDVVDEEIAAAGQRSPHQTGDASCKQNKVA